MYELLGPHVNQMHGGLPERIIDWQPPAALGLNPGPEWVWIANSCPKTIVILRRFFENQPDFNTALDLEAVLRHYMDMVGGMIAMFGACPNVYVQGYNEPALDSAEACGRYGAFEIMRTRALQRRGVKAAVGAFAVGTPKHLSWWADLQPMMARTKGSKGILLLHEYDFPYMLSREEGYDTHWLGLRHRKVFHGEPSHNWPGLPRDLWVPTVISETGIEGMLEQPHPPRGWKMVMEHPEPHVYAGQLENYNQELLKDKAYIAGALIFSMGNESHEWWSYDVWPEPGTTIAKDSTVRYWKGVKTGPSPMDVAGGLSGSLAVTPDSVTYVPGAGNSVTDPLPDVYATREQVDFTGPRPVDQPEPKGERFVPACKLCGEWLLGCGHWIAETRDDGTTWTYWHGSCYDKLAADEREHLHQADAAYPEEQGQGE